ncbi:MAG TPA: type IV pilus biogenesis protein PilM [Paraburkholderia sp.]
MIAIWIAVACGALGGVYALIDAGYLQATPVAATFTLAQGMSVYRTALITYARSHPEFEGSVPAQTLQPLLAPNPVDPLWQNYVSPNTSAPGSLVVVYATSASAAPAIAGIETLAGGSAFAGVALNGAVLSPGNLAVPLPTALASAVPNGAPVWMAQVY